MVDNQLRPRLAAKNVPGGATTLYPREHDGRFTELTTIAADDFFGFRPVGFAADDRTVYLIDSRGRDTTALVSPIAATR